MTTVVLWKDGPGLLASVVVAGVAAPARRQPEWQREFDRAWGCGRMDSSVHNWIITYYRPWRRRFRPVFYAHCIGCEMVIELGTDRAAAHAAVYGPPSGRPNPSRRTTC